MNDKQIKEFALILEKAVLAYDHMCKEYKDFSVLGDDHYSGNCIILFKGDKKFCTKVEEFIRSHERPT